MTTIVFGLGMRTIWISLRAMNYTDRAFSQTIRSLETLSREEKRHINNMLRMQSAARMNVQVGMLYGSMAVSLAQNLFGLAMQTQAGAEYMEEFAEVMNETKVAFADTLFTALKPLFDVFLSFMKLVRDNAPLRVLLIIGAGLTTVMLGLYAAHKLVTGAIAGYNALQTINQYLTAKGIVLNTSHTISVHGLTISYMQLAAAIGAAFGTFAIVFTLLRDMNPVFSAAIAVVLALAAAFWFLYAGISAATLGVGLAIGGAAAGAAMASATKFKSEAGFQMGTRSAPFTGLVPVHKGEVIYNPATERPTQIANDLGREGGPSTTFQNVDISIGTVNTKSEVEDLDDKLSRTLRHGMRANR